MIDTTRYRLGKRHWDLMRAIVTENHGPCAPTEEHHDLNRWGYLTIVGTPAGTHEYYATADGKNALRTWIDMKEPDQC